MEEKNGKVHQPTHYERWASNTCETLYSQFLKDTSVDSYVVYDWGMYLPIN